VSGFRVVVTETAEEQIGEAADWWAEHRPKAPELFAEEIERGFVVLATFPLTGAVYAASPVPGVRRLLLRRCGYHLYYSVDEEGEVVAVRALWHAARGRGPAAE